MPYSVSCFAQHNMGKIYMEVRMKDGRKFNLTDEQQVIAWLKKGQYQNVIEMLEPNSKILDRKKTCLLAEAYNGMERWKETLELFHYREDEKYMRSHAVEVDGWNDQWAGRCNYQMALAYFHIKNYQKADNRFYTAGECGWKYSEAVEYRKKCKEEMKTLTESHSMEGAEEEKKLQKKVNQSLIRYLDCPCELFITDGNSEAIEKAYGEACKLPGITPLVVSSDYLLWEYLRLNSELKDRNRENESWDMVSISASRRAILEQVPPDGKEILNKLILQRHDEMEDGLDWDSDIAGLMAPEDTVLSGGSLWDDINTLPMLLALIPVEFPWQVFAWVPFGNWNECPDNLTLMSAAKYWYEKYGAVPTILSHDVLEFKVPQPVDPKDALELALEHYAICPDCVVCMEDEFEEVAIRKLADNLTKYTVWYFWWD